MGDKEYVMEPSENQHSLNEYGVTGGKKKELCQPSQKDIKPPQLSFKLKKAGDVPKSTETWSDDHLPIDILLLTAESCDFLSCFSLLDKPFKSYKLGIGYVYFGRMGDASDQEKLKVALMNCPKGAATPGGSLTAVLTAVRVLRPKAAFSVGTCISLGSEKVRMGDVVISSKLTAEGFRTPVSPLLGSLIQDAPYGWVAPLENPGELEVKVHCDGDILSQSLREKCRCDGICAQYPGAVAIETEGKGVYAAAYDANIEWVIVKGVASYLHQSQSATSEWMSFASSMAASVVAKMLNDPAVFREWQHYNQGVEHATLDQDYSSLRSGDLESAIGAQDTIQHTGVDHGTLDQGALLLTSNRLASAFGSQSRIEENSGKGPLHCLETTTSERKRQNTDVPETVIDNSSVIQWLKEEYNRRAEFSPLRWSKGAKLQLEDLYARLSVVSSRYSESSEISVDDIFSSSRKGEDSVVLLEGYPGIGKTLFCLKLAQDWANGAMPSTFPIFKLVLLLKCKDIEGHIMHTISEQLLPRNLEDKTRENFLKFIGDVSNQERILIILDGWNELPEKSKHHVDNVLARRVLNCCYVMVTTGGGRELREGFKFNFCLEMVGLSKDDSFDYIRKHFKNIGTEQSSKGERLIEEIKRNCLLQGFLSDRPNLFLLCLLYEDHEGELPCSSSDLYQTLVRCLFRRYCAKQKLKPNEEDMDLAKQFEREILALGELAWKCLLNFRRSFREDDLKLARIDENSMALGLGFVYKEESSKRSNPHHVFTFVHRTFQEYLAASYIAHNLRGSEFYVLGQVRFMSMTWVYRKVFLFVCGILREETSILFTQIGDTLQKDWDWSKCSDKAASFFTESWKESGNAERMANTLCSFLPFPQLLHVSEHHHEELINVLEACAGFSKVQTPTEVHVAVPPGLQVVRNIQRVLAGVPNVKMLILPAVSYSIDRAEVGEVLRASKTLEKVTFALSAGRGECWASALDVGFGADSSLSSVGLRINGTLNKSALEAVENLLFSKCLSSLSITMCGDVQELLVKALARGLAGNSAVKFLDLYVNGKLSFDGAYKLEEGILRNGSLRNVKVSVNGELPVNWQAVGENLHAKLAEKGVLSAIYPNTFSKVKGSHATRLNRMLSKTHLVQQNVTVNVWGELSGDGCKAVCELLLHTPVSHLTLNIHGQLTDEILRCTARCVKEQEKPSSITINAWVQMTEKENNLINELGLDKNPLVSVNVCGTSAPSKESSDSEVISIDEPSFLYAFFNKADKVSSTSLSLTINLMPLTSSFWLDLGEVLAKSTSLKSLTLAVNIYGDKELSWLKELGKALAKSTSLNSLTLAFNIYSDTEDFWVDELGEALAKSTSLNSLTLTFNIYSDTNNFWLEELGEALAKITSLVSFTLAFNIYSDTDIFWLNQFGKALAKSTSLNSLTLVFNIYSDADNFSVDELGEGLAGGKFLTECNLTVNICGKC